MSTPSLTEFLLARIAEDEAVARAADPLVTGLRVTTWTCDKYGHVAVDPARVLAECEAKRRIVEEFNRCVHLGILDSRENSFLRDLAAVYSDHPAYRGEWKPL